MFEPKQLRASYRDYEPFICEEIMKLHHSGHYLAYIKNLNEALGKVPEYFKLTVPEILSRLKELPEDIQEKVRNNGGGVSNHEILWEILSTKETTIRKGKFLSAIEGRFGNWETFKDTFVKAGNSAFGSGWTWLVISANKELKIYSTPNQDSPYMKGDFPVFGLDIWEHAYYIQYKNIRANYIEEIWKILDWEVIEKRYLSIAN